MLSANAFNLDKSENLLFGKDLINWKYWFYISVCLSPNCLFYLDVYS